MSLQEVQTAAARVIHVDRLSDADSKKLQSRIHYHPLDIDGLFSVVPEPKFSVYGTYCHFTLIWLDTITLEGRDIRFFIDQQLLTIIGETTKKDVGAMVNALRHHLGSPESQLTPAELVHLLLQRLRHDWSTTNTGLTSLAQKQLTTNAQVIRQFGQWLQAAKLTVAVPSLIIDAQALDGIADRPIQKTITRNENNSAPVVPFIRTYAVASALMVAVVLVVLTFR